MSQMMTSKLIREHDYVAEVDIELTGRDEPWGPYMSLSDANRLDEVRIALRRGDLASAMKHGRVYRLAPLGRAV